MQLRLFSVVVLTFGLESAALAGVTTVTFEGAVSSPDTYDNNAGASGEFVFSGNSFNNVYDSTYGVWSGWAISNMANATLDPADRFNDYNYQYTSVTGSGAGGSPTYAVAYTFGPASDPVHPAGSIINLASGANPVSIDVTNTTYNYLSMAYGDNFTQPFTDQSFFTLDIAGFSGASGTGAMIGDVTFDLASGTNILTSWQTIDLTSLAGSQSLVFGLTSSDNDPTFGMNTPAFFAADNLVEASNSAVPEPGTLLFTSLGMAGVWIVRRRRLATRQPLRRGRDGR